MPSVWIERRETADRRTRYRVKYRLGGRENARRYAGFGHAAVDIFVTKIEDRPLAYPQ